MTQLTEDLVLDVQEGNFNDLLVTGAATIYEGSAVGVNASTGYVRQLVAADRFAGHAFRKADNSDGSDGDIRVKVRAGRYRLKITLASVAITDIGKKVYMSDGNTYTLTSTSNSEVGVVVDYVTTNTCIVEFEHFTNKA